MITSVPTPAGTWATLPMGRLDEVLNTFWQLFWHPASATVWSNQVEATATATNGGLVLADDSTSELAVGIRPSSYLTFTPIVYTTDSAKTWQTGLLDASLAARPDALALGPAGQALAVADATTGLSVLQSQAGLSNWQPLVDLSGLGATAAGRSCGIGTITAVAYIGSQPAVGASCARTGAVGVFALDDGTWTAAGPALPASLRPAKTEVLSLHTDGSAMVALIALVTETGTSLVTAWRSPAGTWSVTPALTLPPGASLDSYGSDGDGGDFVLMTSGSSPALDVARASSHNWQTMPAPPAGTVTVAFDPGTTSAPTSSVEALSGDATVLNVWSLDQAAGRWSHAQTIKVPIQYGSSGQ